MNPSRHGWVNLLANVIAAIVRLLSASLTGVFFLLILSQVAYARPITAPKTNVPAAGISRLILREKISPAFEGARFADAGPYELLIYHVLGTLDPTDPANRMIAGLKKAPLNHSGLVQYGFDVAILRPIDMSKGNGKIVYDVTNRGHGSIDLSGRSDAGVAFYLRRGYTFVESAWQGELKIKGKGLAADFLIASDAGRPIIKVIRQETTPLLEQASSGTPPGKPLPLDLTYPMARSAAGSLAVYVREREADAWHKLSSDHLRVIDQDRIEIVPAHGFGVDAIYDVVYPATDPTVEGIGMASVRDLISFLRADRTDGYGELNPLIGASGKLRIKRAYAMGVSQSGRFLRVFVWQGFNQTPSGQKVFDAVMPILAGARKGDFNRLFAQPGTVSTQHLWRRARGNNFPFAYPVTYDPITHRRDGILLRCSKTHTCPKIVHLDSDNEMGSAFSWMLTTDADGHLIRQPTNVRLYLAAGLQHIPGDVMPGCLAKPVPYSWGPFQHALFVAMDQWASKGVPPPPSRYPTVGNGGLVSLETAKRQWPTIPGYPYALTRNVPSYWDYSTLLPKLLATYPILTPRLDRDGNPEFGILHPQVSVPVATVVGYSLRVPSSATGEQCLLQGEIVPFALTREEREKDLDPRPSIAERYPGGQAQYAAELKAAAKRLVAERLLLPEDVQSVISARLPTASPSAGLDK